MKNALPSFAYIAFLFFSCTSKLGLSFPVLSLVVNDQNIRVEAAISPEQSAQGLMFRKEMPENEGMLFIFSSDKILRFYMKNTLIPLSIAYLDRNGTIEEIYDMYPLDETAVSSKWPVRYALEMNQGWFERHRVAVGDTVQFLQNGSATPLKMLNPQ